MELNYNEFVKKVIDTFPGKVVKKDLTKKNKRRC